ncbi:OST-HTH/LOTUS domain-containing protein [Mesorhizobium sp.]
MESEDGWVPTRCGRNAACQSGFRLRSRTFSFRKLSDLVRKTNAFEIERPRAERCASESNRSRGAEEVARPSGTGHLCRRPCSSGHLSITWLVHALTILFVAQLVEQINQGLAFG